MNWPGKGKRNTNLHSELRPGHTQLALEGDFLFLRETPSLSLSWTLLRRVMLVSGTHHIFKTLRPKHSDFYTFLGAQTRNEEAGIEVRNKASS